MQHLAGHTSFETAYLIPSYPYGRLRCRRWCWIEYKERKGFRFVAQTENPKTGRMNAPKRENYFLLGMELFLNEDGHVKYAGISEYSSSSHVLDFVKKFPEGNLSPLSGWVPLYVKKNRDMAEGKICFNVTINGVVVTTEEDRKGQRERAAADLKNWEEIRDLIRAQPVVINL